MKSIFHLSLSFFVLIHLSLFSQIDYTKYVDPFIGTAGHGHTFPGATVPFGMVQLSPDTRNGTWDGCSGYHASDSIILGFSHTHLSGTGCGDLGDILIYPFPVQQSDNARMNIAPLKFQHINEVAEPGYYSVLLNNGIKTELSATPHCGIHRYTFPGGNGAIAIDLNHGISDKIDSVNTVMDFDGKSIVTGMRTSNGWAKNQVLYFVIEFSSHVDQSEFYKRYEPEFNPKNKIIYLLPLRDTQSIIVKVGISAVSIENAKLNLDTEIPDFDFEKVKKDAHDLWQQELSRIEVSGGLKDQFKIFYTALYHCMISPNLYSDVNGEYRGRDFKIHTADGFKYYTVFSLWDTFRALHPLFTIIKPSMVNDMINTFLCQYQQGGLLPVWELQSNETECMIGYHSVSVIADAALKGIMHYDLNLAFEAMKKSAESAGRYGLGAYIEKGFLTKEDENESVSKTLEYAYDDWCIAQMAKLLHHEDDYKKYIRRAQSYKNIYDGQTGFMTPRTNGGFVYPFDPREVNNNYTEANAWQYTFFVPHDISGLIKRMGGAERFEQKLDKLFSEGSKTTGRDQADITGLIGQYAHGNEPSHHMAYLYNYIGKPWKTETKVKYIMDSLYNTSKDGLSGNEDCGQMSAWYVMSAMGLYAVTPGSPTYNLSTPLFSKTIIHLEDGKTFTIQKSGSSQTFILGETLNGKKTNHSYISHQDIINGGNIKYTGYDSLSLDWGKGEENIPPSSIHDELILPAPVFEPTNISFRDTLMVSVWTGDHSIKDKKIYLTFKGEEPDTNSYLYRTAFSLETSAVIKAKVVAPGYEDSKTISARYVKHDTASNDWRIYLNSKYSSQYDAGGAEGLLDGIRGEKDWRKGNWQGYQGQNFEAVIDMKREHLISSVSAGFLQDTRSWIMMPKRVIFEISSNDSTYIEVASINNIIKDSDNEVQIFNFHQDIRTVKARFVRIRAIGYGKLPSWHESPGADSWLFVDEVEVK